MKKRPLVCQFASPLDVDIHNTPQVSLTDSKPSIFSQPSFCHHQAIILEGKYWKRKWKVITAEYKKWRRFNVNKAGASNILDTVSQNLHLLSQTRLLSYHIEIDSCFESREARETCKSAKIFGFVCLLNIIIWTITIATSDSSAIVCEFIILDISIAHLWSLKYPARLQNFPLTRLMIR